MADRHQMQFGKRLQRIGDNHRKLAGGHVAVMNPDGLIVAQPQVVKTSYLGRCLVACLIVTWAFKVYLHASIGAVAYQERVADLQNGSVFEQMGAYIMAADPVTVRISGLANIGQ